MIQCLLDDLQYAFKNIKLLQKALTHKSTSSDHNERLEFLGDAVLNLYVTERLYNSYGELSEGKLTLFKSSIVSRENLNLVAEELRLQEYIKIGKGEKLQGNSILGNTLEAVIGAIFIDAGYKSTTKVLENLFKKDFLELEENSELKDPKSALQEYIQKTYKSLPQYSLKNSPNSKHSIIFEVECKINEVSLSSKGSGSTRKRAELDAANNMLEILKKNESKV